MPLILSLIAIGIAIYPRFKQAWEDSDSAFWAIGGLFYYMFLVCFVLLQLLTHLTITWN